MELYPTLVAMICGIPLILCLLMVLHMLANAPEGEEIPGVGLVLKSEERYRVTEQGREALDNAR